jgi:hypothetical protein
VQRRTYPTRRILALDPIDGAGSSPSDIEDTLLAQLLSAQPSDAVVRQRVTGLPRDLWALVDLTRLRAAAEVCLHHRVEPIYVAASDNDTADRDDDGPDLGDLESLLLSLADDLVPAGQRAAAITNARRYLGTALGEPAGPDDTADTTSGAEPADPDTRRDAQDPATAAQDTEPQGTEPQDPDTAPPAGDTAEAGTASSDADAAGEPSGEPEKVAAAAVDDEADTPVDLGDSDVGPAAAEPVPDPIDNPAEVFASFLDGDFGLRAGR